MLLLTRIPERLPDRPALVRQQAGSYAIWTGRSWHGSINKVADRRGWYITTPASPVEVLGTFNGARAEAETRAIRAEGSERVADGYWRGIRAGEG